MRWFSNWMGRSPRRQAPKQEICASREAQVEALLRILTEQAQDRFWRQHRLDEYELSYEERYAAYLNRQEREIAALADSGDVTAQYLMGTICADHDEQEAALHWFECASMGNNGDALYCAGIACWQGWGCPVDEEKALTYLTRAAGHGCCYQAAEAIRELYARRGDRDALSFRDMRRQLFWTALVAFGAGEERMNWAAETAQAFHLCVQVELEVLNQEGSIQTMGADPQELEDWALLALYWNRLAGDAAVLEEADLLCDIGECALAQGHTYGIALLKQAAEWGCPDAASVTALQLLDLNRKDAIPPAYREQVQQAAEAPAGPYGSNRHRANALLTLSLLSEEDSPEARRMTMEAAELGSARARQLLKRFDSAAAGSTAL